MKELCHHAKREVFEQCGVSNQKNKPRCNIHHIIFKKDIKYGDAPRDFPINTRCNLIPLPIDVHNELHDIVERTPAFKWNIDSRIWIANYAFNGELDLL